MKKTAIVNANSFARYFPEYITKLEQEVGEVTRFTLDADIDASKLAEKLNGYAYLIVGTTPAFREEFFARCPSVEYIARFGIGYNNVDVKGAKKHQVLASNIPGSLEKEDVAEQAVALLLGVVKHITDGFDAVKQNEWNVDRGRFLGSRVYGKTIGVCGMGNIGTTFARIMKEGFHCKILGYDPYVSKAEMEARGVVKCELTDLLAKADIVSLHINLTAQSYHLIGKAQLDMIKKGAILINTARGELVDEYAVAQALEDGVLDGYGCDVIENEPIKMDHPLLKQKHALITPHLGTYNRECNAQMCTSIVEDVIRVYHKKRPSVVL